MECVLADWLNNIDIRAAFHAAVLVLASISASLMNAALNDIPPRYGSAIIWSFGFWVTSYYILVFFMTD